MIKLGVIFGGRSGEHEVSLMSARSILDALDLKKYQVIEIGISHDGKWWSGDHVLQSFLNGSGFTGLTQVCILPDPTQPGLFKVHQGKNGEINLEHLIELDVIFPVLHGTFGEDGTLQGVFEIANLAYVGGGVLGSALGMDKAVFKALMHAHQIPVVETLTVLRSEIEQDLDLILNKAEMLSDYPLFVKPANLGSSVGITKCKNRSDLTEGLIEAARYDRKVIIERGLDAREIEVSVLGNDEPQASIPGEILPSRDFYSYEAKYLDENSQLLIPAPLPSELIKKIQQFSLMAYRAIDCSGMARVDFLLEKHPKPGNDGLYLSEVNTIPGFTRISMYPKLWEASGLAYSELLDQLIKLALERKSERDRTEHHYKREY